MSDRSLRGATRLISLLGGAALCAGVLLGGAASAGAEVLPDAVTPVEAAAPAQAAAPLEATAPDAGADAAPVAAAALATTTAVRVPTQVDFGQTVVVHVAVTDANGQPADGLVRLLIDGTTFGDGFAVTDGQTDVVPGGKTTDGTDPFLFSARTWTIQADFVPADPAALAPSTGSATFDVTAGPTRVFVQIDPLTVPVGQPVSLSAGLTYSAPVDPTGTVSFFADGQLVATAAVSELVAHATFNPSSEGSLTITASYSGDLNYAGAVTETGAVLTVTPAAAAPAPTPAPAPAPAPGDTASAAASTTGGGATLAETGLDSSSTALWASVAAATLALGGLALLTRRRLQRRF